MEVWGSKGGMMEIGSVEAGVMLADMVQLLDNEGHNIGHVQLVEVDENVAGPSNAEPRHTFVGTEEVSIDGKNFYVINSITAV